MTAQVRVDEPRRVLTGGSLSPDDLCDIAPCESVSWSADGGLVLTFARDLTDAEAVAVRIRCQATTAGEEALLLAAAQALDANRTYLDLTAPTTDDVDAQVRALTEQVNGLLRLTLKQFDPTDGGA